VALTLTRRLAVPPGWLRTRAVHDVCSHRTRPRLAAVPRDLDAVLDDRARRHGVGHRETQSELGRPGLVVLVLESGIRCSMPSIGSTAKGPCGVSQSKAHSREPWPTSVEHK